MPPEADITEFAAPSEVDDTEIEIDLEDDDDDPGEGEDDAGKPRKPSTPDAGEPTTLTPDAFRQAIEGAPAKPAAAADRPDPFASFSDDELGTYFQKTGDQRFQQALNARGRDGAADRIAGQLGEQVLKDQWDILALREFPFLNDPKSPEFATFKDQVALLKSGGYSAPNLHYLAAQAVAPKWNRKQAMEQDRRRRAQGSGDLRPSSRPSGQEADDDDAPVFTGNQEALRKTYGIESKEAQRVLKDELKRQTRKVRQYGG